MNKKFIGYFTLVEACNKKGGPVGVCVEEDARKQMKNFLYENVNDPELRSVNERITALLFFLQKQVTAL